MCITSNFKITLIIDYFGNSVANNLDTNGDGYADVIVGASQSDVAGLDRGAAYVYHGTVGGVNTTADKTLLYPGADNTAFFGYSVY